MRKRSKLRRRNRLAATLAVPALAAVTVAFTAGLTGFI
jgi:hypothetical protein